MKILYNKQNDRQNGERAAASAKVQESQLIRELKDKCKLSASKRKWKNVYEAIATGDDYKTLEAVLKRGANPNACDALGWTLLAWSANNGNIELCKLMLKYGTDANAINSDGDTPLHIAINWHFPQIVESLLFAGANPFIKNRAGGTASKSARFKTEFVALYDMETMEKVNKIIRLTTGVEAVWKNMKHPTSKKARQFFQRLFNPVRKCSPAEVKEIFGNL